jgi:SAM-dependent methyltransferase
MREMTGAFALADIDGGRAVDWGKTSGDYARHRPGPPEGFYARLAALGVGLPGQRILDLGTGTGVLARRFAAAGADVAAIDRSPEQVAMCLALAAREGVAIDARVAPAEEPPFAESSFDAITANQCWLYFDAPRAVAAVKRLLRPGGVLSVSQFSWLPRLDAVARASEELVLKHNPAWSSSDWSGAVPPMPPWAAADFDLTGMFVFDEAIPFTVEGWCGRIRACRGIGATLPPAAVARFDAEHAELLTRFAGPSFAVLHRVSAHILAPKAIASAA